MTLYDNPETWRASGSTWDCDGLPIFYKQQGSGVPLVCLHGFPTASWDFYKIWPALIARHSVLALDFIGFGYSAKPAGADYSIVNQADIVEALMAKLGIRRAHLLCHDYGVSVGQELLARKADGDGVDWIDCTMLNGGLFPETHRPRFIQRLLLSPLGPLVAKFTSKNRFDKNLRAVFGPNTPPSEAELDHYWTLLIRNRGRERVPDLIRYMTERKVHRERWVSALDSDVPIRIINGTLDPVSGGHMVDRYEELFPGRDVTRLKHIGHYPHMEDPNAVVGALFPSR